MSQLLDQLTKEIDLLCDSGSSNLVELLEDSDLVLLELRDLETQLQHDISASIDTTDVLPTLETKTKEWYASSISNLKSYNSQITRFQKNIVQSSKYNIPLDDAYTFPLMLNSFPVKEVPLDRHPESLSDEEQLKVAKLANRQQLMKSIVLHLVKIGHGSAVVEMLDAFDIGDHFDSDIMNGFRTLNGIVDDIKVKHDLTKVFEWLEKRDSKGARYEQLLFKFHMLEFVLLLTGSAPHDNSDPTVAAYNYARTHFTKYYKSYLNEISPLMALFLFPPDDANVNHTYSLESFKAVVQQAFMSYNESRLLNLTSLTSYSGSKKAHAKERQFIAEILASFDHLHSNHTLFHNLANEFVAEYCSDIALSNDSSLFQSILAGFVNLPNFYKYNNLQRRLSRGSKEDPLTSTGQDLPFQLPDKNQFLFNFHPIFICPVSKEQLVPLSTKANITDEDYRDKKTKYIYTAPNERLAPMNNPVVVFDHCRHLALKDSVRHLSKGGSEVFKCHYCYKKHKLLDVSDAYFIDL